MTNLGSGVLIRRTAAIFAGVFNRFSAHLSRERANG
jgi:hypothetical protein